MAKTQSTTATRSVHSTLLSLMARKSGRRINSQGTSTLFGYRRTSRGFAQSSTRCCPNLDFDVPELPETGLSQEFGNHHLSQSDVDSIPASAEEDHQSGTPNERQTTSDTSVTGLAPVKKAKRSQRGRH
ncbi:hypothetical protein CMEL01_12454 [Colletotrichum melonis]|uniref:Uncharacterized protein n=1 Tax=Colletotrichum melonis TaxID=1209925 RepID=A0AAI9UUS3_9PEZI|nr:hypothetical protein CMEL01_12454 [Colletotrichum melonis]